MGHLGYIREVQIRLPLPLSATFKRTVTTRIKTNFKFQNFVNVDWLILP